jgi:hypothetical protein
MAALAAHLEATVHAAVEARNKRWKATMWSDFLKHAVAFLLAKGRDQDDVVAAAVGLIVYGVTTEEDLQGVAGQPPDDEKFKRQLADKYGVPAAICDMLFAQYVAPSKGEPKTPMRAPEEVAKEYLDGVIGADVGGHLELPEFDYPASFPRNEGAGAVTLRGRPGERNSPNMLLAGLERDLPLVLTRNGLLKNLIEMMPKSMCTIFAVSGQGKTRLACEALCQRFGLLLVTRQRGVKTLNPSSADVPTAIGEMVDLVTKEADEESRESIVTHRVAALLLARVLVLERLFEVTDNNLTPYQWLLAQMYPEQLLGEDVFEEVRRRIVLYAQHGIRCRPCAFAAKEATAPGLSRRGPAAHGARARPVSVGHEDSRQARPLLGVRKGARGVH